MKCPRSDEDNPGSSRASSMPRWTSSAATPSDPRPARRHRRGPERLPNGPVGTKVVDEVRRRVQQDARGHCRHKDDPLFKALGLLLHRIENPTDANSPASTPAWPPATPTARSCRVAVLPAAALDLPFLPPKGAGSPWTPSPPSRPARSSRSPDSAGPSMPSVVLPDVAEGLLKDVVVADLELDVERLAKGLSDLLVATDG
jgi:hypothetical protein